MQTSARTIEGVVPHWRWGMWWFLASEIVIFGGLIVNYLLYRLHHPEWLQEAAHTMQWVGITNTLVLLSSSLTMILADHAVATGALRHARRLLAFTITLGLVFLGFKSVEYTHEIRAGMVPSRSLFWGFYFLMTGLHALHVIGGLIANAVVRHGIGRGHALHRIESVGIYWHFVDIVWIFLFPLLYLGG